MAPLTRARKTCLAFCGVVALAGGFTLPAPALAAPRLFGHGLLPFGVHPARPVVRYAIDTGGAFVLDRSGRGALLKFSDSPEVWVLSATRGARGDVVLSTDVGRPLVRTTKFGGVTVFTHAHPEGSAASEAGASPPIRLAKLDGGQLFQRLALLSARATHASGRLIVFEAPDVDAQASGVVADAALVASEAIVALAAHPTGRATLSRIGRVEVEVGRVSSAALHGGAIAITVVPKDGLGGRPSSARVLQALGASGLALSIP